MLFARSRSRLRILSELSLAALPLVACETRDSSLGDGGLQDLTGALTAQGLAVQSASFEFLDMSTFGDDSHPVMLCALWG